MSCSRIPSFSFVLAVASVHAVVGCSSKSAAVDSGSHDTLAHDSALSDAPALDSAAPCAMLLYSANNEPTVTEPYSVSYPAHGNATVAGQGSNAARVGYNVGVTHVSGATGVTFGVYDSDTGEGVPWDDAAGSLTDGNAKSLAIDVQGGASTHLITITFDTPVAGFKVGVTDIDFTSESVQVDGFATSTGGTAVALTDHLLASPSAYPSLALGAAHTGNDAYVVDQTKVQALGSNRYQGLVSGGVSDRTGTVLVVYDDATALQRFEITYAGSNSGVWLAGMTYGNLCGP